MTYVRSHLSEPLDGDSVAEACGVSRKTLCTRFKQETGETPREWRTREIHEI